MYCKLYETDLFTEHVQRMYIVYIQTLFYSQVYTHSIAKWPFSNYLKLLYISQRSSRDQWWIVDNSVDSINTSPNIKCIPSQITDIFYALLTPALSSGM